ncbi:MAG: protein kinase [Polyangiaceae bacterium]|nr:protein kinase [Polyangiaceae bacterium]
MLEGGVLESRYQLLSNLGEGSTGSVWRALDLKLERSVAVKLIEPRFVQTPEALARFQREARAAARLSGPNVAQIYDSGVHAGTPYLTMELLEGESLGQRIRTTGPLTAEATAVVFADMAQAVTKAHKLGIVHRNLKPDNVFLVWEDPGVRAVVLDFGVAKSLGGDIRALAADSGSGPAARMPHYWSPEQMSGRMQVDYRTDLWALAVIAFECLTGRRPFEDQTLGGLLLSICSEPAPVPSEWAPVPAGFDEWFARGVAKDPDARFQSAMEAAAELEQLCDGYAPAADAGGVWQQPVAETDPEVPVHLSHEPETPVPLRGVSSPLPPRVTPIPAPVSRSVPVESVPESESGRRSEPERARVSARPRPPMDSEDFGELTPAERHRKTLLMIGGAAALVLLGVAMTLLVSGGGSGAAAESGAVRHEAPSAPAATGEVPSTHAAQTGAASTVEPTRAAPTAAPVQNTGAAQPPAAPASGAATRVQPPPRPTTTVAKRPARATARTTTKTTSSSGRTTTKRTTGSSASERLKSDLGL